MLLCKERDAEQLPDDITELRRLREAELLRIHHLERSNGEILEALAAAEDSELREAVLDNERVIERKRERVSEIDTWIRQITIARASLQGASAESLQVKDFPDGLAL
mmetsp:Transcript_130626/g.406166  ORF Transcript_130626/g.406166 Transcript_130626/m.406166 type:complete len:107 (-) Transcript_130626:91-411(-)